jgi:hypothetical protein
MSKRERNAGRRPPKACRSTSRIQFVTAAAALDQVSSEQGTVTRNESDVTSVLSLAVLAQAGRVVLSLRAAPAVLRTGVAALGGTPFRYGRKSTLGTTMQITRLFANYTGHWRDG